MSIVNVNTPKKSMSMSPSIVLLMSAAHACQWENSGLFFQASSTVHALFSRERVFPFRQFNGMGIKIRLRGLHSNQKGSWDILQKPFFITELSYYEFGPQISQLHLIGSSSNSVWGTTLTHTFNDSLWPWPKSQPCQRTRPEKVAFFYFHGLSQVFFLRNSEVPRHGQGISNWQV